MLFLIFGVLHNLYSLNISVRTLRFDLIRGFRGNELQRFVRRKRMVGERRMAEDKHILDERISFLYRCFNRYSKHRQTGLLQDFKDQI
uniref:Large ribosomal subunit protein mL51 n=1 Tax=Cyprinus carpio TaxID=7962 RepID=A0A8C2PR16_CYPCA